MSKAESDEITVSHIVRTMYTGKDISLKNVGQFDLEGVRRTDGHLPRHLSTRAGGRGGVIDHRRTCENLSIML